MVALQTDSIFAENYRVLRRLGGGGMGAVYAVEQLTTSAHRALKVMHAELAADERLLHLFQQEARVGQRIPSDHIVKVLDAGVDDASGSPWIIMELLQGEDLGAALAREGPMPPLRAAHILGQITHGLVAAHKMGVVHRDLKPENIFLAVAHREGADVTVKLLDFGIAKLVAETRRGLTMPMGTPLWMAPEQATSATPISPATDVWALGLLAFRMLTGRDYWRFANGAPYAVINELLYASLPSASLRAGELGLAHLLPDGFDAWFLQCVVREPAARFADAEAARDALRVVLPAEPPPLRHDSVAPSFRPTLPPVSALQPPGTAYDARWYVPRHDEELEALNSLAFPGRPAVLWGPSRFGKTWMLGHCVERLARDDGFQTVVVNLGPLDRASLDAFLYSLAARLVEARDEPLSTLTEIWSRPDGPNGKITRLLERHILPSVRGTLVLALDAADTLLGSAFQDDFCSLLRAWAEMYHEPWPRLRLMLAVSTTPALLVQDPHRSPFNLTAPIVLGDLGVEGVKQLASRYGLSLSGQDIELLMRLVGGHPYLVRLIMHRAALHAVPFSELLDEARGPRWILHKDIQQIRSWLERAGLFSAAARLAEDPRAQLDVEEIQQLVRSGVAVEEASGRCKLRNRLYELAVRGFS